MSVDCDGETCQCTIAVQLTRRITRAYDDLMHRIIQTDDYVDEVRDLHALAFPADAWPRREQTVWVALDDAGRVVAFLSGCIDGGVAHFERVAVLPSAAGCGLGRRLMRRFIMWAMREGANRACSYVRADNFPSLVNFIDAGWKCVEHREPFVHVELTW